MGAPDFAFRGQDAHLPGLLGDQHVSVRQERQRPRVIETMRDHRRIHRRARDDRRRASLPGERGFLVLAHGIPRLERFPGHGLGIGRAAAEDERASARHAPRARPHRHSRREILRQVTRDTRGIRVTNYRAAPAHRIHDAAPLGLDAAAAPASAMMGWQRLQLRSSSARPSSSGNCASVGVGKGDWPYAVPVMVDERRTAIRSSEETEDERMD